MSTPTTGDGESVVIYARMSEDDLALGQGVDRQTEAGREMAVNRGWRVVAVEVDNDISALNGATRPGYEAVVQHVKEGKVSRIICWQTSRLFRNRVERAEGIRDFSKARIVINAVKGPEFDLTTAYGRGQFGLLGEFDTMESGVKGERVYAANLQRVAKGLPSGNLGYGWRRTPTGAYVVHEPEAAVVREITDRLLTGESLRAVTDDLNRRGEPSPDLAWWRSTSEERRQARIRKGGRVPTGTWGKTSVKKLAVRYSNVSLRVHHRGRDDEQIVDGAWPSLVDKGKWERVRALLSATDRRTNGVTMAKRPITRPGSREHLLTWGVGECGVCGGYLRVAWKGNHRYGTRQRLYLCEAKGCVGRNEARVDELVETLVIARLSQPDALSWAAPDDSAEREAAERVESIRRQIGETEEGMAAGDIPIKSGGRILTTLEASLGAAEAEFRRAAVAGSRDALAAAAGPRAGAWWALASVSQRRAVVEALLVRVIINPVPRGPGFRPEFIDVEWR